MKRTIFLIFLVANLVFASGIPVVDGANLAQNIQQNIKQALEWVKEANRWIETTKHYSSQLDAYSKQLASQSGVRDVSSFLKDIKSVYDEAQKLGVNLQDLQDMTKDIDKNKLSSKLKNLMAKFFEYNYCDNFVEPTNKRICENNRIGQVQDIAYYQSEQEAMSEYAKNISNLAKKLKNSKDIKESADLNNAIQTQVALMQAEKIKIDLYTKQREANKKMMQERSFENNMKRAQNSSYRWNLGEQ